MLAAHRGVTAGLWLGNGLKEATPGEGPGQALLRDDSRAALGARRGDEQLLIQQVIKGEGSTGTAQAPCLPSSLPRHGVRVGRPTQVPQHQQVFEEFAGPSGLPSSSSSSARASSLPARVRRPSSSFRCACSTSSVRRVKDSLMLRLVQALVS